MADPTQPSSSSSHLTFPAPAPPISLPPPKQIPSASSSKKSDIISERLYVGNLHPTVDECATFLSSCRSIPLHLLYLNILMPSMLFFVSRLGQVCSRSSRNVARSPASTSSSTNPALRKASHADMPLSSFLIQRCAGPYKVFDPLA